MVSNSHAAGGGRGKDGNRLLRESEEAASGSTAILCNEILCNNCVPLERRSEGRGSGRYELALSNLLPKRSQTLMYFADAGDFDGRIS